MTFKRQKLNLTLPVLFGITALSGCTHSDRLGVPDVRFVNGNNQVSVGEESEVLIEINGAGKFKSSFYEGPVQVGFTVPTHVNISPDTIELQMTPKDENSGRTHAKGTVVLSVASDAPIGEYEVKVSADNGTHSAERIFYFKIVDSDAMP